MKKLGYSFLALLAMTTVIQGVGVNTDLVEAAMRGDATAVRSLLDDGADVNATYGDGSTALHWAAGNGNLELTRLLLDAGARVDATTRIGRMTSLFMAAKSGEKLPSSKRCWGAGASANESNGNGTTVLMSAAASGNRVAVRTLIDSGADVNATEETNGQDGTDVCRDAQPPRGDPGSARKRRRRGRNHEGFQTPGARPLRRPAAPDRGLWVA